MAGEDHADRASLFFQNVASLSEDPNESLPSPALPIILSLHEAQTHEIAGKQHRLRPFRNL